MNVYITNTFKKPHNSTKQGDYTNWYSYNVVSLKQPCTVVNPIIELSTFIPNACYAYIPDFNRYYFITNIESETRDIWRYSMAVDALATYKSDIVNSSQYCSRSSIGNAFLNDGLITHLNNTTELKNTRESFDIGLSGSTFILEVAGTDGVNLYAVDYVTLNFLITTLFDATFYDSQSSSSGTPSNTSIVDDTVKTYFNPFQYILSCRYYPCTVSGSTSTIKFGWWDSGIQAVIMPQPQVSGNFNYFTTTFTLTQPTDNNGFYAYDDNWLSYNLFIPGCGDINIPAQFSGKFTRVILYADYWSGQCNAEVLVDGVGSAIARLSGQIGADIRLSNLSSDMSNIGSTLLFAGGSGNLAREVLSNPQANIGSSLMAGVFSALDAVIPGSPVKNALQPNLSVSSATGNALWLNANRAIVLSTHYYSPWNAQSVHSKFNYPDNTYHSLSTLSGYTICESPYIEINGTSEEKNIIVSFMRGGFYIE